MQQLMLLSALSPRGRSCGSSVSQTLCVWYATSMNAEHSCMQMQCNACLSGHDDKGVEGILEIVGVIGGSVGGYIGNCTSKGSMLWTCYAYLHTAYSMLQLTTL